ncbi:SGNH/GDSL hydrolase family protein [Pedobacter sp. UYP1]|uniref:SGNH/GDSL hydrolase family protein n=1 Tax=Pedobacter sp. UYP1 TaxID=1756396 RepID=UPI0033914916
MNAKSSLVILSALLIFVFSSCKKNSPQDSGIKPADPTKQFKVIVLGSSTAAGYKLANPDLSFPNLLNNKLIKDKKNAEVINLAAPGYTTYQIMPVRAINLNGRPLPDMLKNIEAGLKYNPKLLIICMPTNDIALGFSEDEILTNYKVLVEMLDKANVEYLITGTQPRNFIEDSYRRRLTILNNELLEAYPGHVVDYLEELATNKNYIKDKYSNGDGIHINEDGHKVIFQKIINTPLFKDVFEYE